MKKGDKVFYTTKDYEGKDTLRVFIINQISKDGTKFRPKLMPDCSGSCEAEMLFNDKRLITDYETLEQKIMDIFSEKNGYTEGFLLMNGTLPTCWSEFNIIKIKNIKEDDFDDVLNINCEQYGSTPLDRNNSHIKFPALRINNGDYVPGGYRVPLIYIDTVRNLISYLAEFAGYFHTDTFIKKFNDWQEKYGYDKTDELWKDYWGETKQLEWAIDNNIDCADYDRWQCVQRILKHELKYETAKEIFNTLYKKENLEISDCE